jgi:predicted transcriptional regulator
MSRYLRDNGIITVDGVNDRNERVWILTPKGEKFAILAIKMRKLIDGKDEDN